MSQSLTKIYIHIVFSTKYRNAMIKPEVEPELYAFIGNEIKKLNGVPIQINGVADHIHILTTLPKTVTIAKMVEEIKRNSSRWIKSKGDDYRNFYWQVGYGAFSVSESGKKTVQNYIARQKSHHREKSFKKEFVRFLSMYAVKYDEQFLWE